MGESWAKSCIFNVPGTQETAGSGLNRLYNVLCWLRLDAFTRAKWILLAAFFHIVFQNYLGNISLITRYICMTSIGFSVPTVYAFHPYA